MDVRQYLKENILLFDGGMGTMLQKNGLEVGEIPDLLSLSQPEKITEIHKEYVEAGADVVTTNTFGCNRTKIEGADIGQIVRAAVKNAKAAGPKFVALDIGPIGQLLEPMGTLCFEEAYDIIKEQIVAGAEAGADLILFETISDLLELKAGILAAKENCELPIFATMTYQQDGRTFLGTDPVSATITLNSLGIEAQGVNCSLGPEELAPVIRQILEYSTIPVMLQPNAGLPDMNGNYNVLPKEFTNSVERMAKDGVHIIGGCCGTTPEYIRAVKERLSGMAVKKPRGKRLTAISSGTKATILDEGISVIGERINPTGKPKLKEALRTNNLDYILQEAIEQTNAGADILDVNVGLPEIDEPEMLCRAVREIQSCSNLPLQIDSSDVSAIERAVRIYNGKPLINSVNGKEESMEAIFPIVKKYGTCILGLALDEKGIPQTAKGRYEVAEKIVRTAESYGIPRENILIDCLVLTASAQQEQVQETLEAIKLVKAGLGVKCVLGVSNVSFGLPDRPLLNSVFLSAAFGAGLDAPIMNPMSRPMMDAVHSFRVLNNQDKNGENYIAHYSGEAVQEPKPAGEKSLMDIIIEGRKDEAAGMVRELLKTKPAIEIINENFIPALNIVGERFAQQKIFLPQLMQSAETVKNGFAELDSSGEPSASKGKIVLATVKGDIHDIGKNIVKMLLQNYGYEVHDLGKDVPVEAVVEAAKGVKLVGLSALMTTTVKNMETTIEAIHKAGLDCKIMVGGAVLTPEYAKMVGADYYAKDAQESVALAQQVFGE